ncbi:MAG: response regulator [Bacteroidales bacterium]|nr:response regulator [Bacteroidales bacterium]MCF8398233.1 response regulator [Bacteroidales bacterium]
MLKNTQNGHISKYLIVLVLFVFAILVALGGHFYFKREKQEIRKEKFRDLEAIAQLKINQIQKWIEERKSESYFFSENPNFIRHSNNLLKDQQTEEAGNYFSSRLKPIQERHGYENIFLVSADKEILFTLNDEYKKIDAVTRIFIDSTVQSRKVILSDFYKCETHHDVHIDFLAPVISPDKQINSVLILRVDPDDYLYPLISSWPTVSKTSETMIVRKEDDSVLFLNELRHMQNTAMNLKFPLDLNNVSAVEAVKGHEGIFEGNDYRGVKVLSFIQKVPGTDWIMLSEVDQKEIFSVLQYKSITVTIFVVLLFLIVAAGLAWIYHFRQRNIYKNLYLKEKELGKSQLLLKKSQEIGHLGSWELDLQENELTWSEEVYRILGVSPDQFQVNYKSFLEIAHPEDRDTIDQAYKTSVENKEEGYEIEHRIIQADTGNVRYVYEKCDHERDKTGKIVRSIGIVQDITNRIENEKKLIKQNEEYQSLNEEYLAQNEELNTNLETLKKVNLELQRARESAEESDKLKTAFLNNISHEIRTPMNAIMGFANLLKEEFPEEEKLKFVKTINNNASQLIKIIDDVIEISMLEINKTSLEAIDFTINELFEDLYNTHKNDVDDAQLEFEYSIPDDISGLLIHADKQKVRQVMSGFISNALKYTEKGFVRFSCTLQGENIYFTVKDTGMGIPDKEKNNIFDRFFRGESAQKRTIGGTGLGLSIAKELVELMGGKIGVNSSLNEGSEFYFKIPFRNSTEKKESGKESKEIVNFSHLKVLTVEDEPDSQEYLKMVMKSYVKSIDIANNGKEAIEKCHDNSFDLVMMDIKMPVMNGLEASRIIKDKFPEIKIVAQTAYAQESEKEKAMQAGCDDYLVKPIRKSEILKSLEKLFNSQSE